MTNETGVYRIRNLLTKECYVGSAIAVPNRFKQHRLDMETGTSRNPRLKAAFAKYPPEAFAFEVLESVSDPAHLAPREQHWMDKYNAHTNGYNVNPRAGRKPVVEAPESRTHQLRLPDEITGRIDAVRPKGLTAPSRHDWFLQAIIEKLEREEGPT